MSSTFKKEIQSKIISDLLLNPLSLVLGVVGVTGLIASWAFGWGFVAFASVASVLSAVGWALTNVVLNYETVANRIIDEHHKSKEAEKEKALDALDMKLRTDRDPRDQNALRDLRAAYRALRDDIAAGRADYITPEILKQYVDLFDSCVMALHHQFELYQRSVVARGEIKKRLKEDREKELQSVVTNVDWFVSSVASLGQKNERRKLFQNRPELAESNAELDELRRELEANLVIAKKVDAELAELDMPIEERYKEFLK